MFHKTEAHGTPLARPPCQAVRWPQVTFQLVRPVKNLHWNSLENLVCTLAAAAHAHAVEQKEEEELNE